MTLFELFFFFFRISIITFGGGLVILSMVQMEEEKRKNINPEEFADMVSLAAFMPGSITASISWLIGKHYRGILGGFVSVLGAILPPFLIVLLLSPFVLKYSECSYVQGFFRGVLTGTGAIIVVVVFNNVKNTLSSQWWNVVPYLLTIALIWKFSMHPLFAMAIVLSVQFAKDRMISK